MPKHPPKGRPFSRPYTVKGLSQAKCNCGKRPYAQWQVCANGNRWIPLCVDCDIKMNEMALTIAFGNTAWTKARLKSYRLQAKVRASQ